MNNNYIYFFFPKNDRIPKLWLTILLELLLFQMYTIIEKFPNVSSQDCHLHGLRVTQDRNELLRAILDSQRRAWMHEFLAPGKVKGVFSPLPIKHLP